MEAYRLHFTLTSLPNTEEEFSFSGICDDNFYLTKDKAIRHLYDVVRKDSLYDKKVYNERMTFNDFVKRSKMKVTNNVFDANSSVTIDYWSYTVHHCVSTYFIQRDEFSIIK